ncbi:MAG: hypothetical protein HY652_05945 [Acidobacteria bacterium]|nr:hypothetical protein [Acidobacteriota bacterium]
MNEKRKDLNDVIREETSRGRRPIDTKARRQRQQLLADLRKLLREKDERAFLAAIREIGLKDGSPEFLKVVHIWREFCRG